MEVKEHNGGEETFEGLEQEFQVVLSELAGGGSSDSSDKLRVAYQKLTDALRKSHDSEKRLMSKCRELNAEMASNSTKVAAALKLSQEDETTITSLKKELEKAWKMIDAAHDEETRAKETISTLKQDVAHLTQLVEQGAGLTSSGQDHSVNDLLQMNEELNKEKEELLTTLGGLREDLNKAAVTQQEMEALKDSSMETIAQLQQELQVRQNDIYRESRRKTKLEKELKELSAQTESLLEENKTLSLQSQRHTEEQHRLEHLLKDTKILNERVSKDLEQTQQRCSKLQQEVEQQSLSMEQMNQENQQKANDLKVKEEQVGHMRQEMVKLTKMREAAQKKSHQMEEHKANVETQRDMLRSQISTLEKEIEAYQKQVETDKKTIEELVRERDNLNKNMTRAADATQKQQDMVKVQEQLKRNLEQEIRGYRDEAHKQRSIIYQLEKDRDRYINETSSLTQKVLQLMDDIKVRETEIFEYKKKSAEAESKIKQQQNLFESVSFERNLYSKDLTSAQEEMLEMKRKMKMRNQQLEHLKEEIGGKEAALVKEHQEFQRSEKDKEALKAELQSMKQSVEEMKQHIDGQQAEEQRLLRVITEAENQHVQQRKQLDKVIGERDVLGTQLLRRNDELALLYEKIRIQQSVLTKGDVQYQQRLEDVRLLTLEVRRLRREKSIQDRTVSNAEDLRRELFHMQRELLRERTRCRALEEQLENPVNVHRWRKLEATDPNKYELIQKIHALQKRLISKTQELVDKELLLQEKEKLYVELKHIVARRPGPEAAEQLQQYRRTLIERTKKLKVLTAELNMFESSTQESKKENQRLANELQDIKKKYLSHKQQCREERAAAKEKQLLILPQLNDGPRFMGGGFSLNTPAVK